MCLCTGTAYFAIKTCLSQGQESIPKMYKHIHFPSFGHGRHKYNYIPAIDKLWSGSQIWPTQNWIVCQEMVQEILG